MKKSTRTVLCFCLLLVTISAPFVLSDEADEQEQGSQEVVAQEGQDAPAPEGDTEANEGEATGTEPVTEQPEETDGSVPLLGLIAQPINILLAPTACKPGFRVDHKGKCRAAL